MSKANEMLKNMSLDEKVGQVIICRGLEYSDSMERMLKEGRLGGVGGVIIRDKCNKDPEKILRYINHILSIAKIPPFLYLDCESGIPDMFPIGTAFPNSMAVGATHDPDMAGKIGKAIAEEAKMLGFTLICNPVLDVNTNPDNPIIGTRAFGDRTDFVISLGDAYVKGVQEAGVIPTGKHFPGHGDTSIDSHIAMPVVNHSRSRLDEVELRPFRELIERGMKGIMTAHIYYPVLQEGDEKDTPATLSRKVLTDMVKNEWGFEGLIVSDSLTMRAIKDRYGIEKAAVLAFNAGNDLILQDYESDPEITFAALKKAVLDGEIDKEELDASVLKILKMKEWCNVININRIEEDTIQKLNNHKEHIELSGTISKKAVTVLENDTIPLDTNSKTLLLAVGGDALIKTAKDMGTVIPRRNDYLYSALKKYQQNAAFISVGEYPSREELERIKAEIAMFDNIIFATFIRIMSYKEGSGKMPEQQAELVKMLHQSGKNITTIVFGNPYVVGGLPKSSNTVCAYSDCKFIIDSVIDILYGKLKSSGKLPVTINKKYTFGYGL
ncbi:MAG: glycoside hydrolase family 3 protein [Clostridiaceae bacterium]|jgi:beta-N-acetylhexosaminidase|nr:glycoside hydrolase family 3 protein [Clostridiaceae bacterium]